MKYINIFTSENRVFGNKRVVGGEKRILRRGKMDSQSG